MRRLSRTHGLAAGIATLTLSTSALAQRSTSAWLENCREDSWGDRPRFCEVREQRLPVRASLVVDGRANGGISVSGWDQNEILLRAKIQANGSSEEDAEEIAKAIRIETGSEIRAEGPTMRRRSSWSVSYEIFVPRRINLDLVTNNGGIHVTDVEGRLELSANNGGISLEGVAGDVRGETTNGGLDIELTGDRWKGEALDVRTTNGGVRLTVPQRYSARLETGTVNGGMDIDFPITVQGRITRRLTTQLGDGGALVRAVTTNGGVTIRRR